MLGGLCMNKVSNVLGETKMGEDTNTYTYAYIRMCRYTFTSTKQKYHEVLQGSREKKHANEMKFQNPRQNLMQI